MGGRQRKRRTATWSWFERRPAFLYRICDGKFCTICQTSPSFFIFKKGRFGGKMHSNNKYIFIYTAQIQRKFSDAPYKERFAILNSLQFLNQIKSNQMLVFGERGKPEYPEKRVENQQTQPTYDAESGNRTWDTLVEGERIVVSPFWSSVFMEPLKQKLLTTNMHPSYDRSLVIKFLNLCRYLLLRHWGNVVGPFWWSVSLSDGAKNWNCAAGFNKARLQWLVMSPAFEKFCANVFQRGSYRGIFVMRD